MTGRAGADRMLRRALGGSSLLLLAASIATVAFPADPADRCGRAVLLEVRHGTPVCIHASEPAPPGVDLDEQPSVSEVRALPFTISSASRTLGGGDPPSGPVPTDRRLGEIACSDDGTSGNRIQAIYARASNMPDRFAAVVDTIRAYASDADYRINLSASRSGSGRRIRYVHDDDCLLKVARVTLGPSGDDTFRNFVDELKAIGYNRVDRKYLAWVDAAVGICGLAELYADDRASQDNRNNRGPQYARVDAPCWGQADTHELLHTLGAVQDSAPSSSGAGHCIDENDTMCYIDDSGRAMVARCATAPSWQVDCGSDDYFDASPSAGSYLATHWDVANSSFLEPDEPLPPPPRIVVTAPSRTYAGNAFAVRATVSVPSGRSFSVSWSSSRRDCRFTSTRGNSTTYHCPVTAAGSGQVIGKITDSLGMTNSRARTYKLLVPPRRRATTAQLRASDTTVRSGSRAVLTGRLIDRSTGKRVIGMPVSVFERRQGASRWTKIGTRKSDRRGAFTLGVKPGKSTAYVIVSGYTRTWGPDQSNMVTLSVR